MSRFSAQNISSMFFPNEISIWGTPLRIKEKASDRWGNLISGPNPAANFTSGLVFFSHGVFSRKTHRHPSAPRKLIFGACGGLVFSKLFGACGGLLFFCFFGACGGLCFVSFFRRLQRALFFKISALAAGSCFFQKLSAPAASCMF